MSRIYRIHGADFKACPFCGGQPDVSSPNWHDENRRYGVEVRCCTTMHIGIRWNVARDMEIEKRAAYALTKAAAEWNKREET